LKGAIFQGKHWLIQPNLRIANLKLSVMNAHRYPFGSCGEIALRQRQADPALPVCVPPVIGDDKLE